MSAKYNFKQWKLGIIVSGLKALLVAGSTALVGGDWKVFVAAFCASFAGLLESYLKTHPIEDISGLGDTEITERSTEATNSPIGRMGGFVLPAALFWLAALWLAAALLLNGCATARQSAESSSQVYFDPDVNAVTTNHVYKVNSRITASGNSKQALDSMKGSAGKTASIGTEGASQESNQSELIKSFADLIGQIFQAGQAAGKAAATGGVAK